PSMPLDQRQDHCNAPVTPWMASLAVRRDPGEDGGARCRPGDRLMRILFCFLALAAYFSPVAGADDLKFDEVILVEGKNRDISLLYVVLTEPKPDLDRVRDLVVKYAGTALKEAADRKFKGTITRANEKPNYDGNVVFFVRSAKG